MDANQLSGKRIGLWVGGALVLTAVIIGAFLLAGAKPGEAPESNPVASLPPVSESDWVIGSATSTNVLIEYSDFQCPACASYFPLVEQVVKEYSGEIKFVYRHFPLAQHPYAPSASAASEAAGMQGKFWEMYRILFENQTEWVAAADESAAKKLFAVYAARLGLNATQFSSDIEKAEVADKVMEQYRGGVAAEVNATPTFFMNGYKLQNPTGLASFKQQIDEIIAKSN